MARSDTTRWSIVLRARGEPAVARHGLEIPCRTCRSRFLANVFLVGEWRELAEGDHVPGQSPQQAYPRASASEVLPRGLERLRAEARQADHLDMCHALKPFHAKDPVPGQCDQDVRMPGVRPLVIVVDYKRLRQRFRERVSGEPTDTVASPGGMIAEQQVLLDTPNGRY